jgi:hypothetical protein
MYRRVKIIVFSPNRYNPEQFRIRDLHCTEQSSINISQRCLQQEEEEEEEERGDDDNVEE